MSTYRVFDERPIVVALAGPNGAGKTTFYHAHLAPAGLRFVCYIGIASAEQSDERVVANLHAAIRILPHVLVFDNSDLTSPFRLVAVYERGRCTLQQEPLPEWLGVT